MIPSLQDLEHYAQALFAAPWWLLSSLFSFLVCCGLRKWKAYPNQLLPFTCILLCSLCTFFARPPHPANASTTQWGLTCLMVGGILGSIVWGVHRAAIKPLEDKYPWLKSLLGGIVGDDTTPPFPNAEGTNTKPKDEPKNP